MLFPGAVGCPVALLLTEMANHIGIIVEISVSPVVKTLISESHQLPAISLQVTPGTTEIAHYVFPGSIVNIVGWASVGEKISWGISL